MPTVMRHEIGLGPENMQDNKNATQSDVLIGPLPKTARRAEQKTSKRVTKPTRSKQASEQASQQANKQEETSKEEASPGQESTREKPRS